VKKAFKYTLWKVNSVIFSCLSSWKRDISRRCGIQKTSMFITWHDLDHNFFWYRTVLNSVPNAFLKKLVLSRDETTQKRNTTHQLWCVGMSCVVLPFFEESMEYGSWSFYFFLIWNATHCNLSPGGHNCNTFVKKPFYIIVGFW